MKRMILIALIPALVAAASIGCSSSSPSNSAAPVTSTAVDGSAYLLDEEPEGAADVIAAKKSAADSEEWRVSARAAAMA